MIMNVMIVAVTPKAKHPKHMNINSVDDTVIIMFVFDD